MKGRRAKQAKQARQAGRTGLPEEGNPELKIFEPNEAGAAAGPRRAERERERA